METNSTFITGIKKKHMGFFGHIMSKDDSQNLIFTGPNESKNDRGESNTYHTKRSRVNSR